MKTLQVSEMERISGASCFFAIPALLGSPFVPASMGFAIAKVVYCWNS
ncbi:hypothetical protein [Spirosoma montaniterrae]|nr:hypothetical protein [Spirosoma montaniterrae]